MASMYDEGNLPNVEKMTSPQDEVDLSAKRSPAVPIARRIKQHLTSHVRVTTLAEIELLILTFCTGMLDATTFPDYHCFTSNQTGNTVILAMAVLLPHTTGELFIPKNIGVSLGLFVAANWITGQLGHLVGPRSRLWIVVCNLSQTLLVFVAAAIQYGYGVELKSTRAIVVVGLMAFASGSQVVLPRSLALPEISTAMATSAWIDLLIDPKLLAAKNRPRDRRAGFLVAIVAGAAFGAGIYRTVGSATAVLLSGVGKLIVTLMFLLNKAEKAQTTEFVV